VSIIGAAPDAGFAAGFFDAVVFVDSFFTVSFLDAAPELDSLFFDLAMSYL
jgi:hypothetical protein